MLLVLVLLLLVSTVILLQTFIYLPIGLVPLVLTCCKYISLNEKRPELFDHLSKSTYVDQAVRGSYSSDMSIDDDTPPTITTNHQSLSAATDQSTKLLRKSSSSINFSSQPSSTLKDETVSDNQKVKKEEVGSGGIDETLAQTATQPSSRRLSVQDRINLFENKQKEVGSAAGSSGKPPGIAKPDLRRLSSDVSHTNATVLRRWSGASDMSIDLSGEKGTDTPKPDLTETPTEVKKSQTNSEDRLGSSSSSHKGEDDVPPIARIETSSVTREESIGSNSTLEKTQSWSSLTKSEDDSSDLRLIPSTQMKSFHGGNRDIFRPPNVETLHRGVDERPSDLEFKPTVIKAAPPKNTNKGGSGSKIQEAVAASLNRGLEIGSLRSQTRAKYSTETEEVNKKTYAQIEKPFVESGIQKKNVQKNVPRDESRYTDGFENTPPSGKFVPVGSGSMPLEEDETQRSRQLKGNQELNDELKLKANELEKLFAEHKLRAPVEQPNNARRTKPSEDQTTPEPKTEFQSPVRIDGQDHRDALQRSFSEVGFSDDSRGKFYDSYTRKREERLRKQWGSDKAEKEAKLKAMHDSLERSNAEINAKRDSVSTARRRAEKLRSFNAQSAIKREQPLDFGQHEDDEELLEFTETKLVNMNKNVQGKKTLPIKSSSISTPRTPMISGTRSGAKVATGKRRVQTENPLALSVPNFSDLRKENTKPYSLASKGAGRSQLRTHTRSRSTNEETPPVKDEKSGRSQSFKKNPSHVPETSEGVIIEPKSFHRRNNSLGGNSIAKMKASVVTKNTKNEEEYEPDDKEDEFDTEVEGDDVVDEIESKNESLTNSGNGQMDPSLTLTTELPLPMQESPGESPMLWNSHIHIPFSYAHDNEGSTESWNFNSTDTDVARMRKKWGSTQKNILVNSSSSGLQSRKDMTSGIKRFLKFGRKNRGTDNMADWISATTSEGDDDTEDGRDVSNRSSDELRKSRMGYSHESSFNETEFSSADQVQTLQSSIPTPPANFRLREDHLSGSSIKAPRSFFSLSSFRSKGSDSKLR
ncbi:uncharacterized protein [Rutidosis leptorrhynchoides]|uniref:uncharacterized protein isoform X2 n=1 Tax=Rutidosis leptorrhynchoides TaxID=125765 RepID=UPI003A9A0052